MNSYAVILKYSVDFDYIRRLASFIFDAAEDKVFVFNIEEGSDCYHNSLLCMVSILNGDVFCELFFTNIPDINCFDFYEKLIQWSMNDKMIFYVSDFNSIYDDGAYYEISKGEGVKKYMSIDDKDNICFVSN